MSMPVPARMVGQSPSQVAPARRAPAIVPVVMSVAPLLIVVVPV
jgi:hypothetical protein